jgi:hypothetical protein
MALDILFQSTGEQLVQSFYGAPAFTSLAAGDVSEAHMFTATAFLDSMYGDNQSESRFSRAQTPMAVSTFFFLAILWPCLIFFVIAFPSACRGCLVSHPPSHFLQPRKCGYTLHPSCEWKPFQHHPKCVEHRLTQEKGLQFIHYEWRIALEQDTQTVCSAAVAERS